MQGAPSQISWYGLSATHQWCLSWPQDIQANPPADVISKNLTFTGEGWATYDVCFRRKAAITKSLDWGRDRFHPIQRDLHWQSKAD